MTKFSIIIPTFNRLIYLRRILDYYNGYKGEKNNFNIIVADSSSDENKKKNAEIIASFPDLDILLINKYPSNINPWYKCADVTNYVKNNYSVFCADDDFILIEAIRTCVDFLEKNLDYSSVQGHFVRFITDGKKISFRPGYENIVGRDINSNFASQRLRQLFVSYIPLLYSVARTDALKKTFKQIEQIGGFTNTALGELFQVMILIIAGKHKVLPVLYGVREINSHSGGFYAPLPEEMISNKKYKDEYQTWFKTISKNLQEKDKLTVCESNRKVQDVVNLYLKDAMPKLKFRSFVPKTILKVIDFFTRRFKKRHVFYSRTSGKQLNKIKDNIFKYKECYRDKKITILSFASSAHSVEAYSRIIECLKSKGYKVCHIGFSPCLWSSSKSAVIGETYQKYGFKYFDIPKAESAITSPLPKGKFKEQIQQSYVLIKKIVGEAIGENFPDVFLTDIDRYIPLIILNTIKRKKTIPMVLIEHGNGEGFDYLLIYKNIWFKKIIDVYRFFRYSLLGFFQKIIYGLNDFQLFLKFPTLKLYGENGADFVCCFSKFNSDIFQKFGIPRMKIKNTGYPYFDKIFLYKKKLESGKIKKKNERKIKILIIISGINWAKQDKRNSFYHLILKIYSLFQNTHDIYLRVKPGEEQLPTLSNVLNRKLKEIKIKYDNNLIPSYETIPKYDLIIGEAGSAVMTEALLFHKSVVVFNFAEKKTNKLLINNLFEKRLNAIIIDLRSDLKSAFEKATGVNYNRLLLNNFKKYQEDFLMKFDGKAGERIANVIIGAVNKFRSS